MIHINIIETHGWEYWFEVERHYFEIRPWLLDGSVNLQA